MEFDSEIDADLIAELIAKRDAATKDGDPSWVTFYADQISGLGEEVGHAIEARYDTPEQSDAWLVEFERQLSELLAHTRKRIG